MTETVEIKKEESRKPINCKYTLPAYTFYEIVRAVNGVVSYGLDSKDTADVSFNIAKNGIEIRQMDKSREIC